MLPAGDGGASLPETPMTAYRDDVAALEARKAALEHEVAESRRQLADVQQMIADVRSRPRLPVVDDLRRSAHCATPWSAMTGDERVRRCGACDQAVFRLDELTRDEAQRLFAAHGGNLCVTYYQRADGTVMLADCAVGVQRRRRHRLLAAGAAAALAGLTAAYFTPRLLGGKPAIEREVTAPDAEPARQAQAAAAELEARRAAFGEHHFVGRLQAQLDVTADELDRANRELTVALREAVSERAQVDGEIRAARARSQAARAEAEATQAAAIAAQAEADATRAELDAVRARVEVLQQELGAGRRAPAAPSTREPR